MRGYNVLKRFGKGRIGGRIVRGALIEYYGQGLGAYPGESPRAANIINAFRSLAPHEAVHLARRKGNEAVPEISGTMCACEFTAVTCNVSGNSTLYDSGAVIRATLDDHKVEKLVSTLRAEGTPATSSCA